MQKTVGNLTSKNVENEKNLKINNLNLTKLLKIKMKEQNIFDVKLTHYFTL